MKRHRQPTSGLVPAPRPGRSPRARRGSGAAAGRVVQLALCGAALAGCAELECGVGTHEAEGQCVPNVPVACGPGTLYVRGFCVVDDDVAAPSDALVGGD